MVTSDRTDETAAVLNRLDLLERLCASPAQMRDLVDELGQARSTVNRAVNELEDVGLVERGQGGIRATVTGHFARDRLEAFLRDFDDIVDTGAVLDPLSVESGLEYDVVAGGEGIPASDPTPYKPLERIHEDLGAATAYRALVPTLEDPRTVGALYEHVVTHGNPAEIVVTEAVFQTLREEFPRRTAGMAEEDHFSVAVGAVPSYGLALLEVPGDPGDETSSIVHVVVYGERGGVAGVVVNETDRALRWASEHYEAVLEEATDRTAALVPNTDGGMQALAGRISRRPGEALPVSLEREGFIRLDETYFRDEPVASPATAWRAGLSLAEVHIGYAVDRRVPDIVDRMGTDAASRGKTEAASNELTDGPASTEPTMAASLVATLGQGVDCVIVGPPGSGKSTVCKRVACHWYESGLGPVLYREGGRGRVIESIDELVASATAADSHALVVVEDAVRPDARAIFEAIDRLDDHEDVSVLLDSRESEWRDRADPTIDEIDGSSLDVVHLPPLSEVECTRLVEHFERTVGRDVEVPAGRLWSTVRDEGVHDRDGANEILRLTHRLATYADPLADEPTALEAEVAAVYEALVDDDLALSVGVLANVLNTTGIGVERPLLYAVGEVDDLGAVDSALERLEGRFLFSHEGDEDGEYRTVHEEWSTAFLSHLVEAAGEEAAARLFGDAMRALLALADETDRCGRIANHLGDPWALSAVVDEPGRWAEDTVESIYTAGQNRSQLAALFGDGERNHVELPAACGDELSDKRQVWIGTAFLAGGYYDRAEGVFERLPPEHDRYGPERLVGLAQVASERGEFDEAIAHCRDCLSRLEDDDGSRLVRARVRFHLGKALAKRGALDDATEQYEAALAEFRGCERRRWTAETLRAIGGVELDRGSLDRADELFERSRDVERDLGNRRGEAESLYGLGNVAWKRGAFDAARSYHESALEIRRELGDRPGEAASLNNLGTIATKRGNFDRAVELLERSLEIKDSLGDRPGVARALSNLGAIEGRRSRYDRAAELFERSLEIRADLGDRAGTATTLNNLGQVENRRGRLEAAFDRYERSLEIKEVLGDRPGIAATLDSLGTVAMQRGDDEQARAYFDRALEIATEIGDTDQTATSRGHLAVLAIRDGREDLAREHLDGALEMAQEGNLTGLRLELVRARLLLARDDLDGARRVARAAGDGLAELGSTYWVARSLRLRGHIAAEAGENAAAREHCIDSVETFSEIGAYRDALETLETLVGTYIDDDETAEKWRLRARELFEATPEGGFSDEPEWLDENS